MPMPPGSARGWPFTKTARWAWMWYASCSVAPQLMPSTLPVPVVPAEARSAPDSIGMPSKPTCVPELPDDDEADVLELLDDALLLPQPASAKTPATSTATEARGSRSRAIRWRTVPGDTLRWR